MSSITTSGSWIWLPTPSGAADRLRAYQPGGSGTLAISASNGTLACRENGLRTLWEDRGGEYWIDLLDSGDATGFRWEVEDSGGVYARYAGIHRVRLYGEHARLPRIQLTARVAAPSTYTVGIILLATAPGESPETASVGAFATATTTSTSLTTLSATLGTSENYRVHHRTQSARDPSTRVVEESGDMTCVALWVGAWCTSGSSGSKGQIYGPTIYLRPPTTD